MQNDIKVLHEYFCQEAQIRNYTPKTISVYKGTLRGFLNFHEQRIQRLDEISTEILKRFLYEKFTSGAWTADTFLHYYKGLKSFLDWCVKGGYLETNPIIPIAKPKLKSKLPKCLTEQDSLRILDYTRYTKTSYRFEGYRNHALLAIMLYSGLRVQEVLNLRIRHIDLMNRRISVVQGKGGKDRNVPISPALKKILQDYIEDRNRLEKQSDFFFTSLQGGKQFTYSGLKRVIGKIKAGTGIHFSPHRLRHTFATLMLEGSCDLFSLQKMMGHSDIKTTTIYLSTSDNMLQQQIVKHPLG